MTPMVKATMTPMAIALEAIFRERITVAIMAIAAVAEISAAGAITHGTSRANHVRVCMVIPPSLSISQSTLTSPPLIRLSRLATLPLIHFLNTRCIFRVILASARTLFFARTRKNAVEKLPDPITPNNSFCQVNIYPTYCAFVYNGLLYIEK